ncbi:MAG: GH92 family glycosyl hydrolase [Actinomycetota bacterium]
MRRTLRMLCVVLLLPLSFAGGAAAHRDAASWVDPFIGTLGAGFVFPGPAAPYGMVQVSPDTEGIFAYTGYQWMDQYIRGFSNVHVESMGVVEGGYIPFMPTTGDINTDVLAYQSKFEHTTEHASPGYYGVHLDTYGIDAELTAGLRVGMRRYRFPATDKANVLIDAGRQIDGGPDPTNYETASPQTTPGTNLARLKFIDDHTLVGTANTDRANGERYAVSFAAQFDRPFASKGLWTARGEAPSDIQETTSTGAGAAVSFDTTLDQTVTVKVGVSFIDEDNALANLQSELPGSDFDFDGLRSRTRDAWNDALGVIDVEGGAIPDRIAFATALYHAQHHPNIFNDANGEYLGHDNVVHTIGAPGDAMPVGSSYYANFSLWDTYRAEMPLLALIAPSRYKDMLRSLAAIQIQHGRLPRWSLMNRTPDYMIGEPAIQTVADAFCRGLVPPESRTALYDGIRSLALVNGDKVSDMKAPGYVPAETSNDFEKRGVGGSGPSTTLELASAEFAYALVADKVGTTADRDEAVDLATRWVNVFDGSQFAHPRYRDGTWAGNPYIPEDSAGFKEGTGWQYTWLVPHDPAGLFSLMGRDTAEQRLDTFFSTAANTVAPIATAEGQQKSTVYGVAYYGNQYAPSNEHDLQAPYLYNWLGQPWKTQALARAYQSLYRITPDGLPGNDDLGTMSAWFVWSALGFYPNTPGSPIYTIGSPLFPKATINYEGGGSFTIDAPLAPGAKYIAGATLNNAPLNRAWFTHDALTAGGALHFDMLPAPSLDWGTTDPPPSQSDSALADFACGA